MTLPVVFSEKSGVGFITLNSEETLNALTLQMVELMIGQLRSWQYSNHIYAIFLEGCGEKAFCAGGDVQAMRLSSIENQSGPYGDNNYAETF
ncbi:MAG: enoyl-CoA hydratase/carnithine racemase, partial [Pseudohongiellaceae bacterium]